MFKNNIMAHKPLIGLVLKSLQAEFFLEMKKGAVEYAQNKNSFELVTVGTSTQTEIELQIQLINSLIEKKVDALVVIPIDSRALVPVVVKAGIVTRKRRGVDLCGT
jgi:ribose transport system substrate-binding protein